MISDEYGLHVPRLFAASLAKKFRRNPGPSTPPSFGHVRRVEGKSRVRPLIRPLPPIEYMILRRYEIVPKIGSPTVVERLFDDRMSIGGLENR
jgi:hypothetical protein